MVLPHEIVQRLTECLQSIPGVVGVFLAGSAARGELLCSADGALISDVEVGVVVRSRLVRPLVRRAQANLIDELNIDLELFMVTRERLSNGAPTNLSFRSHIPNITMYEIGEHAAWLWNTNLHPRRFESQHLPAWEAIRLLLNRLGEGAPWLLPAKLTGSYPDDSPTLRWALKLLVAIGDAHLLLGRKYRPSYAERRVAFANLEISADSGLREHIIRAYDLRTGGAVDGTALPEPKALFDGCQQVLERLLAVHRDHQDSPRMLSSLEAWARALADYPPVPRHQAPLRTLDTSFDALAVILRNARRPHIWRLIRLASTYRVHPSSIVYGLVATSYFGNTTATMEHFMPGPVAGPDDHSQTLKAWWNIVK